MKNILILLLLAAIWNACKDENEDIIFADISNSAFSFRPIAGGAVMHYVLPDDPNVVGIRIRYKDAFGNDVLRAGSNTCDSVKLVGFNEAQSSVAAQISLCYYDDKESQPIEVVFSTEDSGPVAFMKSLECFPNWGGFSLRFDNPKETSGMAHVFYLGTDPVSNLPDTILINSFLLEETDGAKFVNYTMQQDIASPTVVVRVEDFRGYMVDEKVWPNVENLVMAKLSPTDFAFYCDNSIEDEVDKLGVQYLFDGDTKGLICYENENNGKCCSFLAGPDAAGEAAHPMYVDLKQNRIMASVRFYNLIKNSAGPNWSGPSSVLCYYLNENEIPCEVTVYGLKDDGGVYASYDAMNSLEGWEEIGTFEQDKSLSPTERWCLHTWDSRYRVALTKAELKAAPEEYMDVTIPAIEQGEGYRYLKIVVNEVFDLYETFSRSYENNYKYVQFHELEIYTDK